VIFKNFFFDALVILAVKKLIQGVHNTSFSAIFP